MSDSDLIERYRQAYSNVLSAEILQRDRKLLVDDDDMTHQTLNQNIANAKIALKLALEESARNVTIIEGVVTPRQQDLTVIKNAQETLDITVSAFANNYLERIHRRDEYDEATKNLKIAQVQLEQILIELAQTNG